jgi:hypothetical protein
LNQNQTARERPVTRGKKGTYREPSRDIPVYGDYDVVVVGGGCAGFAAALAARRAGAKTLVIEKYPFFGGTATAGLMTNINGFRNQVKPDGLQTSRGIAEEVILKLKDIDGLGNKAAYKQEEYPTTPGKLSFGYPIDPERLKWLFMKLIDEAKTDFLFHTWFCDSIKDGPRCIGVVIENKSGREAVYARTVVDASGDADVAARAGATFRLAKDDPKRLPDTLMYRVAGADPQTNVHWAETHGVLTLWGPDVKNADCLDGRGLSEAERDARLGVYENFEKSRKENPTLKNAVIVETACLLGVRQTRFIDGEYTMTVNDVLGGARFEDAIAMASKPIISYFGYRRYLEHEGYEIPYRCMVPKRVDGIIAAGRCISSDQPAFESWRSMAPSMNLGEAAGIAAAMCADGKIVPRQMDTKALRQRLIAVGAEVGQSHTRSAS